MQMQLKHRKIKVTVVGSGYVGLSLAVLLAQHNEVVILDVDKERVKKVNNKESTVVDEDIQFFLKNKQISLLATTDKQLAYKDASFVVIATPTDYDTSLNHFDTSLVDIVVKEALEFNKSALVVIKSTIPVGHTKFLQKKMQTDRVTFSPEFLREGRALKDNLYPSRIIIGSNCSKSKKFADILKEGAKKKKINTLFTGANEVEAIKLFANTYLAMRISFFNELDSYALLKNIDTKSIINGICLDERIGEGYNNPSFGYGGYCLPKDTKQLLANFEEVPQTLIEAIVTSNTIRKNAITDEILKSNSGVVGFYRLAMKEGSDNFRSSAIQGIMRRIKAKEVKIILFEPSIKESTYLGSDVINDLSKFKTLADIIVANRLADELDNVTEKVFSRDIFREN